MFLLVLAHPGSLGQGAAKRLCVLYSAIGQTSSDVLGPGSILVNSGRRLLDLAAQLKCSAHAALGLAINCAQ